MCYVQLVQVGVPECAFKCEMRLPRRFGRCEVFVEV